MGRRRQNRSDAPGHGPGHDGRDGDIEAEGSDPESVARSIALRRLAAAPQTRSQLDRAMRSKGVPEDVRERVLDRFTDVKLVDDAAFAAAWVESRHAGRGLGRRALDHELRQRGVAADVVEQAVEALPQEQEEQRARQLVASRLSSMGRLDAPARMRRLVGMLARKGYPPGLAYRVVRDELEASGARESELPPELIDE